MKVGRLSDAELELLERLMDAHKAFVALGIENPNVAREWADGLHRLQDMVLAWPMIRAMNTATDGDARPDA